MKRRTTQGDADRFREEYERWDKFGAESETAEELARRLGISKATLYRLRDRHWRVGSNGVPATARSGNNDVPAVTMSGDGRDGVMQWLTAELLAARAKITELERQLKRRSK